MNPTQYRNRSTHETTVELLSEAEFRVGEMKERVVIYTRKGKFFVRRSAEFHAKFEKVN